jgi:hypothetical protein
MSQYGYTNLTIQGYDAPVGVYFAQRWGGKYGLDDADQYRLEWPTVPLHP